MLSDEQHGQISKANGRIIILLDEEKLDFETTLKSLQEITNSKKEEEKADEPKTEKFPVTVNYDLSREKMNKAGKYEFVNENITEKNFPIENKGQVDTDLVLVHFGKSMSSNNVLKELEKLNLRPANLSELSAFGAKFPQKQREFPIIALGSVWDDSGDGRNVPYLRKGASGRYLCLDDFGGGWGGNDLFLAACK